MEVLYFLNDHIAISLVALVVGIALAAFLAQKLSSRGSADGSANKAGGSDTESHVPLDQSPAAKAFRAKLKEISLDLDRD